MDKYCCRPSQPRAEIGTLSCAQMHEMPPIRRQNIRYPCRCLRTGKTSNGQK